MEKSWALIGVILAFAVFELCNGLPMDLLSHHDGPNAQLIGVLVGVMVSVCVVIAFIGCVCCQRRQGFKVFRDSPVSASVINETSLSGDDPGHVNPIANPEFTIFTPLSPPHHNNNVFRSHQPVISYIQNDNQPELPNKLVNPDTDGIDVSSWFDGSQSDFPRSKLKYIRELGNGWFGRVVEGEAQDIIESTRNDWAPVAVRILESSASAHEQALYLHEANMYRHEPPHPNIVRLLGRSLEATPLLLIQEFCPKGDLKKFLLENRSSSTSSIMTGVPLKFCCQLASAVQFLHEKNLPHLDLAARTCHVTSDLNMKLGDYGLAVSQYPHDYYQGTPAVPVRWCAPETLNYTNTTLQPKQVTCEGNIWSFGVTMWEICEWGSQPYEHLTDDEVISQVMGAPHIRLPAPSLNVYYIQPLYRLMQLCWQSSTESRPQIKQIYSMLMHLLQQYQQNNASKSPSRLISFPMEDFDCRWETFKPNTIVKTDNHVTLLQSSNNGGGGGDQDVIFSNPEKQKSPSLTNLHGSLENLIETETPVQHMDSWLQNVANHTSDMQYVRGLSQAIQALDSALASEQTSSSSSSSGSSCERGPAPASAMDSGSETEDETWKRRIERGAYSEKVRQKSKSVADLMILTHIDCSDTDSETPLQSLEYRNNYNYKNVRCKPNASCLESATLMFGSEGNLLEVQDTFQEELKKLKEERRDSLLFVPSSTNCDCDNNKILNESVAVTVTVTSDAIIVDKDDNQIISDTTLFIRQQVSNLINQISCEAEELYEQAYTNATKSYHRTTNNDAINRDDKIQITSLEEIKQNVESFIKAEQSNALDSFILNDIDSTHIHINQDNNSNNQDKLEELFNFISTVDNNSLALVKNTYNIDESINKTKSIDLNVDETINPTHLVKSSDEYDETNTNTLQELHNVDNRNKISRIITCTKEDYKLVQNFINNERNGPIVEFNKIMIVKNEEIPPPPPSTTTTTTTTTTTNLLNLHDNNTSNTQQPVNQVYNVYSVQIDHKPPPNVFPMKSFYTKPFNETDLIITDINELLLLEKEKNERDHNNTSVEHVNMSQEQRLSNQLNLVCTSRLPNDHIFNVLNTPPPLINGFDSDLSQKIKVSLKDENQIPRDYHRYEENVLKHVFINSTMPNSQESILNENISDNNNTTLQHYNNSCESSVLLNNNNNNETTDTPKRLSDLASDILVQHCLYMNENCDLKTNKIIGTSDSVSTSTSTSIHNCTNEIYYNPRKLSDIILESLTNNPEYKNETAAIRTDVNTMVTSTPFKSVVPKQCDDHDSLSECSRVFSLVSEGDEASDSQATVILGPCEDYTLGLYSGLKTTYGHYYDDGRPEEEILQFSSNFMPQLNDESIAECEYFASNNNIGSNNSAVDFSLETWDRFLGKTMHDHDDNNSGPASIFEHDNVFNNKNTTTQILNNTIDVKNGTTFLKNDDKTFNINDENKTFTIEENVVNIDDSSEAEAEAVLNSWEPGEGWFLHPQVPPESLTGDIDISGSDNTDDNSYVRFTLDEECVNALRNELVAKLPHAQGSSHEEQLEPEEWDTEERNEVIVKYNVYATPLSPIPEESYCEDVIYCDPIQHRDSSDSESDWSEPCLGGRTSSQLEDILVVDTETHAAQLLESPSLREPPHRHTPSQDSCCSNDTLFNLEDLNYGLIDNESPLHHGLNYINHQNELNEKEHTLEIEISNKQELNDDDDDDDNSNSIELNLTYTKPDINVEAEGEGEGEENDNSNKENTTITINSAPAIIEDTELKHTKLELKLEPGTVGVAPLPSPEDIPWKQIPASLLTYNEMVHHPQNDKFENQTQDNSLLLLLENNITSGEEIIKTLQDNNNEVVEEDEDDDDDVFHNNDIKENVKLDEDLSDSQKECTIDADLYSNLTDIRFSGPCDAQLMSTSFSESVDYADERDWDSGSDTRSSSSGEFIWKEGEHEESLRALHAASHDAGVTDDINPMDAIAEENSSDDSDDCEEDIEETEFVPSAWDAQATPTKSALRSPEKSSKKQQKGVSFKKQKYHCVYEYPREPESPIQASTTDLWRPLSDFPNFADWELDPDACVPHYDDNPLDCRDGPYDPVLDRFIPKTNYPLTSGSTVQRDLYQINPFPHELNNNNNNNNIVVPPPSSTEEEDFYISSSTRPFQSSSQFFPGQHPKAKFLWQDYQSSSSQSSRDLSDNITPDSGIDDVTPASLADAPNIRDMVVAPKTNGVPPLKYLAAQANKKNAALKPQEAATLGGLRHTRNRLKLDLPLSPNSFTSNRTFAIDADAPGSSDPVAHREVPAFTTFGKTRFSVQHVPTPTEDYTTDAVLCAPGQPAAKNVSFEALPHKPHHATQQPLASTTTTVYIVNKPEESDTQKPAVESVQGEASLLDSADEDSGIESSANATLERREQQIIN